jgi:glycosyltransferase involved in cell wall biosynthesis
VTRRREGPSTATADAARVAFKATVHSAPVAASSVAERGSGVPVRTNVKCLAIVPAYNEASCISSVVEDLRRHAAGFDVLVVDDGSTDNTAAAGVVAGATVVRLPFNLGIGGAVQAGYVYALERDYDVAVQVDGDGQHDARHVEQLLDRLRSAPKVDMVTGSRFLAADGDGYRSSATRRLGIRLFAAILSIIVGQRVTDPTSGFRMAGRRGIELFARDYPHDYPEVEAVLLLHFHELRSVEVPVNMRDRIDGASSINATRSAYYMVKVLLAIVVGLLRTRPAVQPGDPSPVVAERRM